MDWKEHADNLAGALRLALDGSGPDEPVWAGPAFRALHHYQKDADRALLESTLCQCPSGWLTANFGWHRGPNACPRYDLDQLKREAARTASGQAEGQGEGAGEGRNAND